MPTRTMVIARFAAYSAVGFAELWLLLFMWGFSAGPASSLPYYALVGCLILVLIAGPLALLLDRLGSAFACPGSLLAAAWAVAAAREGSLPGALVFGAPSLLIAALAVHHLWSSRGNGWLSAPSTPRSSVRVSLALLPIVLFLAVFNEGLVLAIVIAGPPR